MNIKVFAINPFEMNCYVYFDGNSGEGVLIDPAAFEEPEKDMIGSFIKQNNIIIKYIINTHGHIDHILGNKWAKDTFDVPLLIHRGDFELLKRAVQQGEIYGLSVTESPYPDKFIEDNDNIKFNDATLKVIHTPGHSPGGVCLVDEKEKVIIAGDTLFQNSIGRTDLLGGDLDILLDSIMNKLLVYDDNYIVYPGHLEPTTIGEERENNPFLR